MIHKGFLIVVTPTCLSSRGRQIGTWHSWTGTGPCWYALSDTHHFPPYLIKPTCCDAFVGKIDLPVYNQYLSTSSVFNLRDSPLIECSLPCERSQNLETRFPEGWETIFPYAVMKLNWQLSSFQFFVWHLGSDIPSFLANMLGNMKRTFPLRVFH